MVDVTVIPYLLGIEVLNNVSTHIVSLKGMFRNTQDGKCTEKLHEDIKRIIPRAASIFKMVESAVLTMQEKSAKNDDGEWTQESEAIWWRWCGC